MQNHVEQEWSVAEGIKELNKVNRQLAKLNAQKEELVSQLVAGFQHEKAGQKTYEYDVWKVEIKTPVIYALDKKLYESGELDLPAEYNPVKQSVSYTIDKKRCDEFLVDAPAKVRKVLAKLITQKPGKPTVTIKERV